MKENSKFIVEVKGLDKRYDSFHLNIPDLAISKGEFLGIIGENGAGKTTFINLILDLVEKDSGVVKVFGSEDLDCEIKKKIAYVSEMCNYSGLLTIKEINKIMKNIYEENWDENSFLSNIKEHSIPPDKILDKFSTGMKAKLCLFIALAHLPMLLILDEATSNLDPIVRRDINTVLKSYIKKTGCAIIFSSHLVDELEDVCDRILLISNGKIKFDARLDEGKKNYCLLKLEDNTKIPSDFIGLIEKDNDKICLIDYGLVPSRTNIIKKNLSIEDIMYFLKNGDCIKWKEY